MSASFDIEEPLYNMYLRITMIGSVSSIPLTMWTKEAYAYLSRCRRCRHLKKADPFKTFRHTSIFPRDCGRATLNETGFRDAPTGFKYYRLHGKKFEYIVEHLFRSLTGVAGAPVCQATDLAADLGIAKQGLDSTLRL